MVSIQALNDSSNGNSQNSSSSSDLSSMEVLSNKSSKSKAKLDYLEEISSELRRFIVNKNDIQLIRLIGASRYYSVYLGLFLSTKVAIKIYNKDKTKSRSN